MFQYLSPDLFELLNKLLLIGLLLKDVFIFVLSVLQFQFLVLRFEAEFEQTNEIFDAYIIK